MWNMPGSVVCEEVENTNNANTVDSVEVILDDLCKEVEEAFAQVTDEKDANDAFAYMGW